MHNGFQQHPQQLMRQQQQRRMQMGGAYVAMQRRKQQELARLRGTQLVRRPLPQVPRYVPPPPPSPKELLEGHRGRQPELVARLEGATEEQLATLERALAKEEEALLARRGAARKEQAAAVLERDLLRASTGPLAWLRGRFDEGRRAARLAAKERLRALEPRLAAAASELAAAEGELTDAQDRRGVLAFWRKHFAKG